MNDVWKPPANSRGLIFDCDGTLVDSMPRHYDAWVTVLGRHDLDLTEARFYEWAGVPVDVVIRRLAAEKGVAVDADAIAAEREIYFLNLPQSELRPVRAVVEIVRRFHGRLPMAVATGSTRTAAEASMRAIGVLDLFDAVISSQDGGLPKPAPDVFLMAAERISVSPGACVAFEDGDAGLEAARAAGMHVVDVRPWLER